jgi:hypothetical protein
MLKILQGRIPKGAKKPKGQKICKGKLENIVVVK